MAEANKEREWFFQMTHTRPNGWKIRAEKIISEYRFNCRVLANENNETFWHEDLSKNYVNGHPQIFMPTASNVISKTFHHTLHRPPSYFNSSRKKTEWNWKFSKIEFAFEYRRKKVNKWKLLWHKTTYQFNLGACFVKYRAQEKIEKNCNVENRVCKQQNLASVQG